MTAQVGLISPTYTIKSVTLPTHDLCCERAGSAPPSGAQQASAYCAADIAKPAPRGVAYGRVGFPTVTLFVYFGLGSKRGHCGIIIRWRNGRPGSRRRGCRVYFWLSRRRGPAYLRRAVQSFENPAHSGAP